MLTREQIKSQIDKRVKFIRGVLEQSGASGIVYGNSGGKDSALVGILCRLACSDTVGIIMPCRVKQNFESDKFDAEAVAKKFDIKTRIIDLTKIKNALVGSLFEIVNLGPLASSNIAPRLRMTTLYAIASSENRLVAGTGNRSEAHVGYFTKWGDGAYDFNPIADLTVTEIYKYLEFLEAPKSIINKPPSAALFDGQTDENEMGITYRALDTYLLQGKATDNDKAIIQKLNKASEHKRKPPISYENDKSTK